MILGIETATPRGSLALLDGDRVLAERELDAERHRHAASLLSTLDAMLIEVDSALDRVAGVAVSVGPGSFTGLRIGLATALGLCFGSARWIVPVPTLSALSTEAGEHARIAALLDARRGQVYAGLYGPGGKALEPDVVTDPIPWLAERSATGSLVALGPGVEAFRAEIEARSWPGVTLLGVDRAAPRASAVARLGAQHFAQGLAARPEDVQLVYIRPSDAKLPVSGTPKGGSLDTSRDAS